ncbi:FAD dependent oxidoreductase [Fusarium beomiforme]|uniref:FAD dependent oxidoreductase n=1 Tax=Fusarium beomiforme TaxID=44412 RepID=A0A9P5A4P1_9HYPO|nr:FAD dependent oxidoreductase [Fusarium beomiforme]
MATFKSLPQEENSRKIRVAIIGAGLSGLAVANGLLKDPAGRFDVQIFERDTVAFNSERGGYQIRMSANGLNALKTVSDPELWSSIREVWSEDREKAPTLVDPVTFKPLLRLDQYKWYPKSRALSRLGLRRILLQRLLVEGRVHFNYTFQRYELMSDEGSGVRVHFEGQDPYDADILIAADGASSRVNRQIGINNKIKLHDQFSVHSRGRLSQSDLDELPESLVKYGPTLFLGGENAFGYASIYNDKDNLSAGEEASKTVFWSLIVSGVDGEDMMAKAGSDPQKIIPHLIKYVRNNLGYGEPLVRIIQSATEFIRTGPVTTSFEPEKDWRNGINKNSRVILLGDALHPMPPSRGMGANQALTDAGNLVDLFLQTTFKQAVPSDEELAALVSTFDEEMYTRAFNIVKTSGAVTTLDAKTVRGKMILAFVGMVMTAVGWLFSSLEIVGLKEKPKLDFVSQEK